MLKRITGSDYAFSVITKLFSVLSGIIYSILFSRYLGVELRGTASIINNYADLISIVLCLGVFQAYPYYKKKKGEDIYERFVNNIYAIILLFGTAIICVVILCPLKLSLIVALLISPVWMGNRQLNYVILVEKPRISNIGCLLLDLIDLIAVALLMLFTSADIRWCVFLVVIKQIVFFVICNINVYHRDFSFRPSLKGIWPYIRFGIVPMFTFILMEVNYKTDILMLGWYHVDYSDIGIYSLGVMIAQNVWLIPDALKDILLSKLVGGKGVEEVSRISRLSFFFTLVCELLLVIFGKPIIRIMFGKEYENAYGIILIVCGGVLAMVFYKMIYSYNVTEGAKNVNLFLLGMSALLNIILNAVTIPSYGVYGAAIASLISYVVCGAGFLLYFCRKTKTKVSDVVIARRDDIIALKK